MVKNPSANAGNMDLISQEDFLEKELATDSSVLGCEIPWTAHHVAWWATVHRVTKELDTTQGLNNYNYQLMTNLVSLISIHNSSSRIILKTISNIINVIIVYILQNGKAQRG